MRYSCVKRNTKETEISIELNLDGNESRIYKKYWDASSMHFIEPNL